MPKCLHVIKSRRLGSIDTRPEIVDIGRNGMANSPSRPATAPRSTVATSTNSCRMTHETEVTVWKTDGRRHSPGRSPLGRPCSTLMTPGKSILIDTVLSLTVVVAVAPACVADPAPPPAVRSPPAYFYPAFDQETDIEGALPRRPKMGGPGWRGLRHLAVHGVLILDIETERLREIADIAQTVIQPLEDDYVEVLVYFRRPGERFASRRVQWTPRDGYVTTDISIGARRKASR